MNSIPKILRILFLPVYILCGKTLRFCSFEMHAASAFQQVTDFGDSLSQSRYHRHVRAFGIAAFFVFLAEMGDKTQLVALLFATRYKAITVLAGVFVATFLVHLGSVGVGEAAGTVIPAE